MPAPYFNGRCQIFTAGAGGSADFVINSLFFDDTSNFTATDVEVGDFVVDVNGWLYEVAVINTTTPLNMDVIDYENHGTPANGAAVITRRTTNNRLYVPTRIANGITEFLKEHVRNISLANTDVIGNKIIQGVSGFAAHELDGSNNDVNSYIEWNITNQTHYHKVEPKTDGQDLDIKIGFQFPSTFIGLKNSGNVFEFYGFADNGSGDTVNYLELVTLVDTDGTEYQVTGKQITSSSKTLLSLTKTEVDSILNPIISSSSSASTREWGSADAGKVIYARYKLFGNDGDLIYLDADNAFMYIE